MMIITVHKHSPMGTVASLVDALQCISEMMYATLSTRIANDHKMKLTIVARRGTARGRDLGLNNRTRDGACELAQLMRMGKNTLSGVVTPVVPGKHLSSEDIFH
jgi:hypothetical protein